ncbi:MULTISPECIES: hypothetical protein [unclassified Shinella]|jgi:hypothetical protein|uniref:hypothetical protein n=1 Tax=unclassified Shinella TaxID=2643062 RepID=UPI00102D5C73|nr:MULTISPECIES: hypothetical protein [unclassified Shinella]MDC7264381.1 hypothetical protein [Shinella sp. HY16]MDC7271277.1 hypothetical protein [Shinella sp. YZ44]MDG4675907.1 hypothetical protein [Shinella sp. 838]TAA53063.1 hypothetical protein EXZ48_29285 [Shinella sp. JR1-6]
MPFHLSIENAKHYLVGFILGLVAAPLIAFNAGWVSTASAQAEAVKFARVETLEGICSATASSTDLATVKGYEIRAKRDELAAALADIQVPADLLSKVTFDCERTLS